MGEGEQDDEREKPPQQAVINVYHHFPDPIVVDVGGDITLAGGVTVTVVEQTPPPTATRIELVPGTPRHE